MKKSILFILFIITAKLNAQDTFSIIAIDSATGEVGAAGASCVDLFNFPYPTDFISDIIPGKGGANTQAYYDPTNQKNATARINAGDNASQVIRWLVDNDAGSDSTIRQYGIVTFVGGHPQAAGFTGSGCMDYKEHRAGKYYSIQGNILLGKKVIDSIESHFLASNDSLACKLMAALQGGKMVGADSRCAGNGTSTLFGFLKVTKPTDEYGKPYISVGVKTHDGDRKEPIDSLQKLFDTKVGCWGLGIEQRTLTKGSLYPNPSKSSVTIILPEFAHFDVQILVKNTLGQVQNLQYSSSVNRLTINVSDLKPGVYFTDIVNRGKRYTGVFVRE